MSEVRGETDCRLSRAIRRSAILALAAVSSVNGKAEVGEMA